MKGGRSRATSFTTFPKGSNTKREKKHQRMMRKKGRSGGTWGNKEHSRKKRFYDDDVLGAGKESTELRHLLVKS